LIESGPVIHYRDGIQGPQIQDLAAEVGDFVLRRADGLFAYQLAVVVDDAAQGVTDVVRGADLLLSTPRQIRLQQRLGLPTPQYAHLPVVLNGAGQKLSKQSGAEALCFADPAEGLTQALRFLGHEPPRELGREPVLCVLDWALANWQLGAVPTASRQFAPRPV
jgi:glutamyl-Q tRNA(Asp) synthetase